MDSRAIGGRWASSSSSLSMASLPSSHSLVSRQGRKFWSVFTSLLFTYVIFLIRSPCALNRTGVPPSDSQPVLGKPLSPPTLLISLFSPQTNTFPLLPFHTASPAKPSISCKPFSASPRTESDRPSNLLDQTRSCSLREDRASSLLLRTTIRWRMMGPIRSRCIVFLMLFVFEPCRSRRDILF